MKKRILTSVMLVAAMTFAGQSSLRPESSVPTPAEKSEISRETPDLSAKDNEEWQRMRAERREARRQILSDLRNSSANEKQAIRQDVSGNRDEKPRVEGDPSRNMQPRERDPFYGWQEPRGKNPPPPPPPRDGERVPDEGWGHHRH
ncbi:MAG: hypothetical protein MJY87_04110 [Fibrobacter sp.]|nr:hypothetical protein [Fibrobacter sp.]